MRGKVETSATLRQQSDFEVTIERLESGIATVVELMERHNRPRLIETVRILEEEVDRLQSMSDPMVEARKILSRVHNKVHNSPASAPD
jgi:hypothetical protein